jgi:uncharacterized membrane protein YpjA
VCGVWSVWSVECVECGVWSVECVECGVWSVELKMIRPAEMQMIRSMCSALPATRRVIAVQGYLAHKKSTRTGVPRVSRFPSLSLPLSLPLSPEGS